MDGMRVFDFHCHGGDVRRTGEIRDYIHDENLSGLVLLSLPLAGFPGYRGEASNLNKAVLETKKHLNQQPHSAESVASSEVPPVYAFGSLDNRALTGRGGKGDSWDPAAQVAAMAAAGFDGLKLWEGKPELVSALNLMPDDSRIAEACREAARRDMPVIFHVADPPEFWGAAAGGLSLAGKGTPDFDELIAGAARLCRKAPDAVIVFPHLGFLAGRLEGAARFLDEAPNARFDLAPGNYFYGELSSGPDESRAFFERYRKRLLFGSDSFFFAAGDEPLGGESLEVNRKRCSRLRVFLESGAEVDNPYPLSRDEKPRIPGLALGLEILDAIFAGNARELLKSPPRPVGAAPGNES